jgi:hypothetical protein
MMDDDDAFQRDPRVQIARIEAELEELAQALERCRKLELFSKVAIAGGVIVMAGVAFGLLKTDGTATMLAGLASVIGGIVLLGSNSSTAKQTEARVAEAEAQRAELIGSIDLRVVETRSLH